MGLVLGGLTALGWVRWGQYRRSGFSRKGVRAGASPGQVAVSLGGPLLRTGDSVWRTKAERQPKESTSAHLPVLRVRLGGRAADRRLGSWRPSW